VLLLKVACSSFFFACRGESLQLSRSSVREDLHAFFFRRRLEKSPWHRFYSIKSSVYEKQNFSFSVKKTKWKPVDACGRRRLEDPAGRSPRKLRISSTASLPVGNEVFLQPSANFNIAK
jgi:hypothetical protein